MTLLIKENALVVEATFNIPNLDLVPYTLEITSQYSHQPLELPCTLEFTNSRYSMLKVTFPTGFGNSHKSGIYNWGLKPTGFDFIEFGLVKIITNPGGETGMTNYTSTPATEERISDVYYRPNY